MISFVLKSTLSDVNTSLQFLVISVIMLYLFSSFYFCILFFKKKIYLFISEREREKEREEGRGREGKEERREV